MIKAFGYLRVSGKGQVDGDGFTRQSKAIREYATAHRIKIVRVFREEGVSGSVENMDRPAWRELMATLHANGIRIILIEKLDRLGIQHSGIKEPEYTRNAMLTFRDPDNIQLEFFWRSPT